MNQLAFAVALEAAYQCRPAWLHVDRLGALDRRMSFAWYLRSYPRRYTQLMGELCRSLTSIVRDRPEWVREYARQVGR